MKIFYITSLNQNKPGGLFNATYERISRHAKKNSVHINNNNMYPTILPRFIKRILKGGEFQGSKLRKVVKVRELTVHNHNIPLSLLRYIQWFIKGMTVDHVLKIYKKNLHNEILRSDIIHAHWGMPHGYIAYLLGKEYKKPYFVTMHGSDVNNIKKKNRNKLIATMENAEKCFFVSEALLGAALKMGYSGKNAIVTYNGVDTNNFQLKNDFSGETKTVAYIGSLEYKKGADMLPKIFNEINMRNSQINFKIIGDGSLKALLKEQMVQLNVVNQVEFTGEINQNEVPSIMKNVDLLVIPSRMEGLGMVVLEANAMGIPVVGSNVGGIPEAIGNNKNVFNLDKYYIFNLCDRAMEILENEDSEVNASLLRNRVEQYFDWESIVSFEKKQYELSIKK
ncbi:glycosyltransferase [Alkalibacillus sp. S2W]|uniref:glycosyltransferase n=1 Tax=Alkalibacillus sp. S2W TaxID=3386553 RepID=UPI00398CD288